MTVIKYSPLIVAEGISLEVSQTITLRKEDLAEYLRIECGSGGMSVFINAMGEMNQKWQSTTCYAALELTKDGESFINDMYDFIHNRGEE